MQVNIGSKYHQTIQSRLHEIISHEELPVTYDPSKNGALLGHTVKRLCYCSLCGHKPVEEGDKVYFFRQGQHGVRAVVLASCINSYRGEYGKSF